MLEKCGNGSFFLIDLIIIMYFALFGFLANKNNISVLYVGDVVGRGVVVVCCL